MTGGRAAEVIGPRRADFSWLLSSSAVSNLADGIAKVAFPLLATTITRDPMAIALLAAAQLLPWLLFGALSGAVLDRIDRRKATLVANVVRAVVIGALGALVLLDAHTIIVLSGAAFLMGTAETVADNAANTIVPSVVARDRLDNSNGKLQSAQVVGQNFLGGPVGGMLFVVFAAFPFLVNSVAFGVAALFLMGMRGSYRPAASSETVPAGNTATGIAEGVRWIRRNPLMLRLVVLAALFGLTIELGQAQLVLYALEDLGIGEAAFGWFAFAGGVGGLVGAAVAPRIITRASRRGVLAGSIGLAGVATGGMGLTESPLVSAVFLGLFAGAGVTVNVVLATVRHLQVPDDKLGRIMGLWRTLVWGSIPLGALIGGVLTEFWGSPSPTFTTAGVCQLVLAGLAWIMLRRLSAEVDPVLAHPAISD